MDVSDSSDDAADSAVDFWVVEDSDSVSDVEDLYHRQRSASDLAADAAAAAERARQQAVLAAQAAQAEEERAKRARAAREEQMARAARERAARAAREARAEAARACQARVERFNVEADAVVAALRTWAATNAAHAEVMWWYETTTIQAHAGDAARPDLVPMQSLTDCVVRAVGENSVHRSDVDTMIARFHAIGSIAELHGQMSQFRAATESRWSETRAALASAMRALRATSTAVGRALASMLDVVHALLAPISAAQARANATAKFHAAKQAVAAVCPLDDDDDAGDGGGGAAAAFVDRMAAGR